MTIPTPYFQQANPVAAFIQGAQAYIGAPQTGVWDKGTHDALIAFYARQTALSPGERAQATSLPAWGAAADPAIWTDVNLPFATIWGWPDEMLGITGVASGAIPAELARMIGFFGLPTDSYESLDAAIRSNEAKIVEVMGKVRDAIIAAETKAATDVAAAVATPWYKRPVTYVIGGGVLLLGVIVLAGRKSE